MTLREKVLVAIIVGLLCGLYLDRSTEAQSPAMLFGTTSGVAAPIQTNGSNALKVLGK